MPGKTPHVAAIDAIPFEFLLQHISHRIGPDTRNQTGFTTEASDRHRGGGRRSTTLREKARRTVLLCALRQLWGAEDVVLHRMTDAEHDTHEEVTS